MPTYHDKFQTNEAGLFTWVVKLCINGEKGYGAFACVMNSLPSVGQAVEFHDTPEGSFSGEVIKVCHVAAFSKIFPALTEENRLGAASLHDHCQAQKQEWQIEVELSESSEHQDFGVRDF